MEGRWHGAQLMASLGYVYPQLMYSLSPLGDPELLTARCCAQLRR
jgi:hypothetical protein